MMLFDDSPFYLQEWRVLAVFSSRLQAALHSDLSQSLNSAESVSDNIVLPRGMEVSNRQVMHRRVVELSCEVISMVFLGFVY